MKTFAICLSLWLAICGCGGEPSTKPAEEAIPSALDTKFTRLMTTYQQAILNNFWTDETTFDMDAYSAFLRQRGFTKIPNSLMDFKGTVDSMYVTILHKTTSGNKGGWVQNFDITVEQDGHFAHRQFSAIR